MKIPAAMKKACTVPGQANPGVFIIAPCILKIHLVCCIPSQVVEVRYAGVDRAAGYRGMLVQARDGHLRIGIQDTNIATPWG